MIDHLIWITTHAQTFFAILFTANAVLLTFVILLENREPERSQGWLLVLFAFPIVGFLIYLFFGHNWHRKTDRQRRDISDATRAYTQAALQQITDGPPIEQRLRRLAMISTGLAPTKGNNLRVLTNAQEKYPVLIDALKQAKTSIDMEYFCFRHDDVGKEIIEILKERARAGVSVRFLVDGYGSIGLGIKAFRAMREAGIKTRYFAPLATFLYFFKANYRDHRKIVIIDHALVITGGINIGLDYLGLTQRGAWRDTAFLLKGPCTAQFEDEFESAWRRTTFQKPKTSKPPISTKNDPALSDGVINVVPSGPDSDWFAIQRLYLEMIHSAEQSLIIQTPYFIPDASIYEALVNAALRGVQVIITLPRYPDIPLCRLVAVTYYGELIRAGGRIYEYEPAILHQKIMIADRRIAFAGTCNIDIRSLKSDFEINILFTEPLTVQRLLEDAESDIHQCREYTLQDYLSRPFIERIKQSFARLIAPLL